MPKILLVDDEAQYRDHLSRVLKNDGHDVRTAANGHEAIAEGTRFHPDILIADWMLQNHVHGLQVCEALRGISPELQTILITGFPSPDLREEAQRYQISRFLEKPFELADLREAVGALASSERGALASPAQLAVVEVDREGAIHFANARAQELLVAALGPGTTFQLGELLDAEATPLLTAAQRDWVTASARRNGTVWHVRAKETERRRVWLAVLVPDGETEQKSHPFVQTLLGKAAPGVLRWPLSGRVLVVDDDRVVRKVVVAQIEKGGGICHTACSLEAALEHLRGDPGIDVVVLDYHLPGEDIYPFVQQIRTLRPDVCIVGSSGSERAEQFRRLGIQRFLLKPWTLVNLVGVLVERIRYCTDCALPLPLRRPLSREAAGHWACAGCGQRYVGVVDESLPPDVIRNVRSVDNC